MMEASLNYNKKYRAKHLCAFTKSKEIIKLSFLFLNGDFRVSALVQIRNQDITNTEKFVEQRQCFLHSCHTGPHTVTALSSQPV